MNDNTGDFERALPYDDPRHLAAAHWLGEEAALLDARQWEAWLELLADDIRYVMPVRVTTSLRGERDVRGEMSHFDEDRYSLAKRVERLATEHALLDDNGDGMGTPADWFRGVRAVKRAERGTSLDGLRAHQVHLIRSAPEQRLSPAQRARRDELEQAIARLRESKSKLTEDEYYGQLEKLLLELARLAEAPPGS